ncbi:uncharacterized protein [Nicotiana tomentosiformis]|uniref:uncharacterized protein n=1 Tax=Nicotiana tomentosiformis TaxID=4098 RepID=UPI00388C9D11
MPESSYRPPAIQGISSGYSGHQGQSSGQQPFVPRGCFECGDFSHVQRFFPKLRCKAVQQGSQPMITAPAVRSPRGGGQAGGGQPTTIQSGGGQLVGTPTRFYAFPARSDAVASDAMITGTFSVCGRNASVLFDPVSTYSYVSSLFAHFLDVPRESLGTHVYVSTPVGDFVVADRIYLSCVVTFCGYETRADLLLLDMIDFEEGRVIDNASRHLKPHEKNYLVHDLELAAIVHALKIWRHHLYGVSCEVYTNHRSLQHLFKQRDLNLR